MTRSRPPRTLATFAPLACLAVALPLLLLPTLLLPGSGIGMSGGSPAPAGGTAPPTVLHPGTGDDTAYGGYATVTIAPAGVSVVSGSSVALLATVAPAPGTDRVVVTSYRWSFAPAAAGSLGPVDAASTTFFTSSETQPTPVAVTVVATGYVPPSVLGFTWTATATASVTVLPFLTVGLLQATPDPASPGRAVTLTADVEGGEAPYHALIDFGDGASAALDPGAPGPLSIAHTYGAGDYTPTLSVADRAGDLGQSSSSGSVLVTSHLGAALLLPRGADQGTPAQVSASVGGGTPPYTYLWSDSWGDMSYALGAWSLTPTRSGSLTIFLTVTDADGQTTAAPPATMSVAPPPTVALSARVARVDAGTPFPLLLDVQGGTPPYVLSWDPGESAGSQSSELATAGSFVEPYTFPVPGTLTASAQVTDALGVAFSTQQQVGQVVPVPQVALTAAPTVPTVGLPFVLTGSITGGVAPYDWAWVFQGPVASGSPFSGELPGAGAILWNGSTPQPGGLGVTLQVIDGSGGTVDVPLVLAPELPLQAGLAVQPARGEVGQGLTVDASVSGGEAPYTLAFSASDGEEETVGLATAGVATIPLVPRLPGNLSIGLQVHDEQGHVALASTTLAVAPELDLLLRAASDPVDVGAPEVLGLQIRGGWAPFVGTVSSPGGTILPFQGSSTNLTFVLTPSAVGPLLLAAQATDALGASATASLDLAVDPAPTADLVLGAGRTDVGVPLPFWVQPGGGTGSYPSVWVDLGDGNWSRLFQGVHAYARPGSYSVNASVLDTSGLTARSPPQTVQVAADPQALAEQVTLGADVGRSVPFASEVSFGTAPFTYLWDFGDGAQSAEADPSHVYSSAGLYRVGLTIWDATGSVATAPTLNVTVCPAPILSLITNRSVPEAGLATTFDAVVVGGAPPTTVVWTLGDGTAAVGPQVNHTYGSGGTFTVVGTASDAAGGTVTVAFPLRVAPALVASSLALPTPGAEVGRPCTLTETPQGGVAPWTWSWQVGGSRSSGPGLSSLTVVPSTPGTLPASVQVVDGDGASFLLPFLLPVAAPLALNLSSDPAVPEALQPFQLVASVQGGLLPVTYIWSLPPGWPDPGNRSALVVTAPLAGGYPVRVAATDALGDVVALGLVLHVALPLAVAFAPRLPVADAGAPVAIQLTASGGVGTVTEAVQTPFGLFTVGSAPITFPTPGVYPIVGVASDQDGAVQEVGANLTVRPPPVLAWVDRPGQVAVGSTWTWRVEALGGSGSLSLLWDVPGVGSWTGAEANLSFPGPGTYRVAVSAQDMAGVLVTLATNVSVVADDLTLQLNVSQTEGLLPLEPLLDVQVSSPAPGPIDVQLSVDGTAYGPPRQVLDGLPWAVTIVLDLPGSHPVVLTARDALGAEANATLAFEALLPVGTPLVAPAGALVTTAGTPLVLSAISSAENVTWPAGERVAWTWWGAGMTPGPGGSATFLSDLAGAQGVHLSGTARGPDGSLWQNATFPEEVRVVPAEAVAIAPTALPALAPAGTNVSLRVQSVDAFDNVNASFTGNVTCLVLSGPEGPGVPDVVPLTDGTAGVQLTERRAGLATYQLQAALPTPGPLTLRWTANPYRAVLRLLAWSTVGSSLLLNVSVLDVFGNALSNVTVTAEVPGGPSVNGTAVAGNVTLLLPGAAGASRVILLGPSGARSEVALPGASDPPLSWVALLPVAVFLGSALAVGLFLRWRRRAGRRNRRAREGTEASPTLGEAQGALEELIDHLPGEDRAALLTLAQEHGIPRRDAEEALVLLERAGRAVRRTDEEGVERWDPPVPAEASSEGPSTGPEEGA